MVDVQNLWVYVCRIYKSMSVKGREFFWEELRSLSGLRSLVWCLEGDFNVIINVGEKRNNVSSTRSMGMFDRLINELNLKDPPCNG